GHRVVRALRQAALEGLALAGKALTIEGWIVVGTRARAVQPEGGLVRIHERHALGRGITASLAIFAACEGLDAGQEFSRYEFGGLAQSFAVGRKGRMHVESVTATRARRVGTGKRGIAVTDIDDARQISPDH